MQYSLRYTILLAMIAVALVAITTITGISLLTTRVEFSRYVDVGNALIAQRSERVVLNYFDTDSALEEESTLPMVPPHSGDNALTDGIISQPNLIYLNPDNFRFFAIDENDVDTSEILFDEAPRTINFLTIDDVTSGLIKAAVFGFIIAIMGCYNGYYSKGGAQGVGRATTNAVVSASILILAANYLMTSLLFSS